LRELSVNAGLAVLAPTAGAGANSVGRIASRAAPRTRRCQGGRGPRGLLGKHSARRL